MLLAQPIGILILPGFTVLALSSAIEPLRIANRYGSRRYEWRLLSLDGQPVADRNGLRVGVDASIQDAGPLGSVLVIADAALPPAQERAAIRWLRNLARGETMIGGVDTGPLLLARAGLLNGRRATAHWEVLDAFREHHPRVEVTGSLWEFDRQRCTCAGGTAMLDLMLCEVEASFGREMARRVGEHCLFRLPRPQHEVQRNDVVRLATEQDSAPTLKQGKLLRAIRLLESDVAAKLSVAHVARIVGLSDRQLHRLFRSGMGMSPVQFRLQVRLGHARHLLSQGDISVTDAALASGFSSRSFFSRSYRRHFNRRPTADRRAAPR